MYFTDCPGHGWECVCGHYQKECTMAGNGSKWLEMAGELEMACGMIEKYMEVVS